MGYNRYRHRSYNISKSKAKDYAEEMESLQNGFLNLQKEDWKLSMNMDSCYKKFDNFELRISNHSADNQYHDLNGDDLIVNVKKSKLEFASFIKNDLDNLLSRLNELDLKKYRFVNINGNRINCFLKGFKTKKEVF